MKRILIVLITSLILFSCDNEKTKNNGESTLNSNVIDTILKMNSQEVSLVISSIDDLKNNAIQNGDYDSYENEPIADRDEYWVHNSSVFYINLSVNDEKHKATLNVDLLKEVIRNTPILKAA